MLFVPIVAQAEAQPANSPAPAQDFVAGTSTYADVVAKLGKPNTEQTLGDGQKVIAYVSYRTKVKGSTFVPIVGLFAGGAKAKVSVRTFNFDAKGVLVTTASTESNSDCKTGITGYSCK